jgi:uncharacterized protein with HEPN domain
MTEAARNLSSEIKSQNPDVQWAEIVGFRNILVHEYFSLDLDIIWETVSRNIPDLRAQVSEILKKLPEDSSTD